ncbi:MAG TPA: cupin domain-containing protein [Kiloniellales bacterium]|jgi:transcriptional regulator with XRE-family HTH domain|nr:cupin domain-containing protein [Kiloniellales bacterium]
MTKNVSEVAPKTAQHEIGATLRRLRHEKGLSLQELARASGVSVGMISQIERDIANPSVRVLTAIRRALNVPLQAMFGEDSDLPAEVVDPPFVRRLADRPQIDLGFMRKELLSSGGHHNLQLMILHIAPGGESGNSALSYPAEKGGLVMEGELLLTVDEQEAHLQEGDSFVFDSALPHSFRNTGDAPAKILWIIGAVQFDRHL